MAPLWRYSPDHNGIVVKDPDTGEERLYALPMPLWKMVIKRSIAVVDQWLRRYAAGIYGPIP